jgi:hypothetical protein
MAFLELLLLFADITENLFNKTKTITAATHFGMFNTATVVV